MKTDNTPTTAEQAAEAIYNKLNSGSTMYKEKVLDILEKGLEDFAKRNHQSKQVEPQGILPSFPRQNESFLDYGRRAFGIREKNGSADFEQVEQPSQVPSQIEEATIDDAPINYSSEEALAWVSGFNSLRDRIKPNQD